MRSLRAGPAISPAAVSVPPPLPAETGNAASLHAFHAKNCLCGTKKS